MSKGGTKSTVELVHEAWRACESGDARLALDLLREAGHGAQQFASYWIVEASCYWQMQKYSLVEIAAEHALYLAPNSPHAQLLKELARERASYDAPKTSESDDTLASFLDPAENRPDDAQPQFDLDKTAAELSRERPLVKPSPEPSDTPAVQMPDAEDQPGLVSETLAEIMIKQGKLADAKKVYIQLSRSQPARYEHFRAKIEAIDKLVLGTSVADPEPRNDTK
jgi:tetratricopeptide (TPR) repeat protein